MKFHSKSARSPKNGRGLMSSDPPPPLPGPLLCTALLYEALNEIFIWLEISERENP